MYVIDFQVSNRDGDDSGAESGFDQHLEVPASVKVLLQKAINPDRHQRPTALDAYQVFWECENNFLIP